MVSLLSGFRPHRRRPLCRCSKETARLEYESVSLCHRSLTGQASLEAIFQAAPILRDNKQKDKGQVLFRDRSKPMNVLSLNSFTKMKIPQISWLEGRDRLDPPHQFRRTDFRVGSLISESFPVQLPSGGCQQCNPEIHTVTEFRKSWNYN